jgi:hypothetical protein
MNQAPVMLRQPLTETELKKRVPSIFATKASSKMGERYTFIPSTVVIEGLDKMGLVPVQASQRRGQEASTARHLLRFARLADLKKQSSMRKVGDVMPEVVFANSHNGRCRALLWLGLFRLVCGNGLVISDKTLVHMGRRHSGSIIDIMAEVEVVLEQIPLIIANVTSMMNKVLTQAQRTSFATQALALRYADEEGKVLSPITAPDLLVPRREIDKGNDLWRTFNVVQENMMRGGLDGKSANGRIVHTREVQDVRKVVTYNTALWDMAMARA